MLEMQRLEASENTVGTIRSDRRLCLAADEKTVVEADDPRAATLLCAAGHDISAKHAAALKLMIIDGHVVQHPSIAGDSAAVAEELSRRESIAAAARLAQEESLAAAKQKAEAMGAGTSVETEEIPVIDASQSDEDLVTQFELEALEKGYGDAAAHHIALQRLAHLRGGGDGYGLAPIPDAAVETEQPQTDPSAADEKQREPGEDKSRVPDENKGKGRGGKNKEPK